MTETQAFDSGAAVYLTGGELTWAYREYNLLNQLIRDIKDDKVFTYQYRPDGLRHSKTEVKTDGTEQTTIHVWDRANIVVDVNANCRYEGDKVYIRGLNLISLHTINFNVHDIDGRVFYLHNFRGDVVKLINQNGDTVKTYLYDAFGNDRSEDGIDIDNPFRYCGEYFDENSGNYYLRFRFYQPRTGRFTQEDPIRDAMSLS